MLDEGQQDEQNHEDDDGHAAWDAANGPGVSLGFPHSTGTPPPGGVSTWQSPLSIRETIIILFAVGGLMYQWSQMSSQMAQLAHDITAQSSTITAIHQDVATLSAEVRTHAESPGHSVSMERIAVLSNRLDDLTARVKALETTQWHEQQHR